MANLANIARPYALAAFECARESQQLAEWGSFLQAAVTVTKNPSIDRLLNSPEVSSTQLYDLYVEVLISLLDTQRKSFLHLLAQNKRLMVLPEILQAFNAHVAALEKVSAVRLVTAIELSKEMQEKFRAALTKRIKRDVSLECKVDPSLIAGAIIHIGDHVIDGSIRGKLTRLQQTLTG